MCKIQWIKMHGETVKKGWIWSWLRQRTTRWEVPGSNSGRVIGKFKVTYTVCPHSVVLRYTHPLTEMSRLRLKSDGTRWRTGGEVKGKLTNRERSQYSLTTSERGVSSIITADAHTSAASIRLKWRPRRFKWTRPFRRKKESGFWACAITFQTQPTKEFPWG